MDSSINVYSSLNVTQQIRIVVLKPGHRDTPIECELQVINLSESPTYQALSYTWGLHRKTAHIVLNGQEVGVGEKLMVRTLAPKRIRSAAFRPPRRNGASILVD